MSPIVTMQARNARVGYTASGGGGGGATTVSSLLVNYGATTTGTIRFTGVYPLPPGQMTAQQITDKKFSVWIGGTEKAIHAEACRGKHPDGSPLGVRYDFDHAVSNASPITASVVIGTVRATTDISRRTITRTQWDARRWLIPNEAQYACDTVLSGMPLEPSANWNAHETAWLDTKLSAMVAATTGDYGTAFYDTGRIYAAAWQTGLGHTWLNEAIQYADDVLFSYHLTAGTDPGGGSGYGGQTYIDTEAIPVYATAYNEPHSVNEWSLSLAYLISGWSYPWSIVNNYAQRAYRAATISTTGIFNGQYGIRFNWRDVRWVPLAHRLDATYTYGNPDYSARACTFSSELPNILTALEANKYDASDGAYRAGLRGQHIGVTNSDIDPGWSGTGDCPTFWLSFTNNALIDYYHYVYADSRIPGWVSTNFGIAMANASTLPSGHYYVDTFPGDPTKYAVPYRLTETANTSKGVDGGPAGSNGSWDPFDICMHSKAAAFLSAVLPSDTWNGKTAAQWLDILTTPGQMSGIGTLVKYVGETFQAFSMPYYRLNGDPGGPASIRAVTTHTDAPS